MDELHSVKYELDVHLAEYNSIRTGIYECIQKQQNLIYITIAIIVGVLTITDKISQSQESLFLLLCGSLLLIGIGGLYLREDATLTTLAAYGSMVLAPKITAAIHRLAEQENTTVAETLLAWEEFKFHYQFDRKTDSLIHRLLIMTRYWLMWFPAVGFSVAYAALRISPMLWFEYILVVIDMVGLIALTAGLTVAFFSPPRLVDSAGVIERYPVFLESHTFIGRSEKVDVLR